MYFILSGVVRHLFTLILQFDINLINYIYESDGHIWFALL